MTKKPTAAEIEMTIDVLAYILEYYKTYEPQAKQTINALEIVCAELTEDMFDDE